MRTPEQRDADHEIAIDQAFEAMLAAPEGTEEYLEHFKTAMRLVNQRSQSQKIRMELERRIQLRRARLERKNLNEQT